MAGSTRVRRLKARALELIHKAEELSKNVLGYIRVSTDEQVSKGHGLESQERSIRTFAESQGYELIEVVSDPGVSGAIRPEERSGFNRVLELAEQRAFSMLLVWKFDRLARNLAYSVTTVNDLRERHGVVLRSVTEPIDTSTPMGEMIFALLAGFAAEERRVITRRTLAGKREKAGAGGFAGGALPMGYRLDQDGHLRVDETEAKTVQAMHWLRKECGWTYAQIAASLNVQRIPTKGVAADGIPPQSPI